MDNQLETIPPDDQQPPGDVTPVASAGNNDPDPPAEETGTSALPVRVPTRQLKQLDSECNDRGIARSELVREIFARHYANKGKPTYADVQQQIDQLNQENTRLKAQLEKRPTPADSPDQATKLTLIANYAAELENDLINAVKIACKAIIPARSDFRKNLKHYGRLEADRT